MVIHRSKVFYFLKIHSRKDGIIARKEYFALTIQYQFLGSIHMTIYGRNVESTLVYWFIRIFQSFLRYAFFEQPLSAVVIFKPMADLLA